MMTENNQEEGLQRVSSSGSGAGEEPPQAKVVSGGSSNGIDFFSVPLEIAPVGGRDSCLLVFPFGVKKSLVEVDGHSLPLSTSGRGRVRCLGDDCPADKGEFDRISFTMIPAWAPDVRRFVAVVLGESWTRALLADVLDREFMDKDFPRKLWTISREGWDWMVEERKVDSSVMPPPEALQALEDSEDALDGVIAKVTVRDMLQMSRSLRERLQALGLLDKCLDAGD